VHLLDSPYEQRCRPHLGERHRIGRPIEGHRINSKGSRIIGLNQGVWITCITPVRTQHLGGRRKRVAPTRGESCAPVVRSRIEED
jgi:hypothetical protein